MNGCSFQQVLLHAVLLHVTISAIFERLQYFNFETDFLEHELPSFS